jgi:hypothetical protein
MDPRPRAAAAPVDSTRCGGYGKLPPLSMQLQFDSARILASLRECRGDGESQFHSIEISTDTEPQIHEHGLKVSSILHSYIAYRV